jgi:hypothetical protein
MLAAPLPCRSCSAACVTGCWTSSCSAACVTGCWTSSCSEACLRDCSTSPMLASTTRTPRSLMREGRGRRRRVRPRRRNVAGLRTTGVLSTLAPGSA